MTNLRGGGVGEDVSETYGIFICKQWEQQKFSHKRVAWPTLKFLEILTK